MGSCPDWYEDLARTASLRYAWPGVPPWEWDQNPIYRDRALCMLQAEQAADTALRNQQLAEAAAANQQRTS